MNNLMWESMGPAAKFLSNTHGSIPFCTLAKKDALGMNVSPRYREKASHFRGQKRYIRNSLKNFSIITCDLRSWQGAKSA